MQASEPQSFLYEKANPSTERVVEEREKTKGVNGKKKKKLI